MLSDEDERILTGFVFDRQCAGTKTALKDVLGFCVSDLHVDCSEATVSRYLAKLGFVSRKM